MWKVRDIGEGMIPGRIVRAVASREKRGSVDPP